MGQRVAFYELKSAKESKILSHALCYVHRLMAHTFFGRKEGDGVVTKIELTILYCMVNDRKLDICHVIALKLKDVATKFSSIIKIGGLVTVIVEYYGYDLSGMDYDKVKRVNIIGIIMMQSMGLVQCVSGNYRLVRGVQKQVQGQAQEEEEEEEIIEEVMLE